MTFAQQLKAHRKRLGITQVAAAAILGDDISPRTYWEWEKGKTEPYAVTQEGALARLQREPAPKSRASSR